MWTLNILQMATHPWIDSEHCTSGWIKKMRPCLLKCSNYSPMESLHCIALHWRVSNKWYPGSRCERGDGCSKSNLPWFFCSPISPHSSAGKAGPSVSAVWCGHCSHVHCPLDTVLLDTATHRCCCSGKTMAAVSVVDTRHQTLDRLSVVDRQLVCTQSNPAPS